MHAIGHIEIPTTDFKAAKKFYGKLFGWKFEEVPD
jgi:predicted enzyme related to lactoylglutathione lyase